MTAASAAGHALETRRLQKRYGTRVALAGLDLAVPTGVVYGFLGPNGAGKLARLEPDVALRSSSSGSSGPCSSPRS